MIRVSKQGRVLDAAISQIRVLVVASALMLLWLGALALSDELAAWEVREYPAFVEFEQLDVACVDGDAHLSGEFFKLPGREYIVGKQTNYVYLKRSGAIKRMVTRYLDQPPDAPPNKPVGLNAWGPWVLVGACSDKYEMWGATVEHTSWHPFWTLRSTIGPLPLPPN